MAAGLTVLQACGGQLEQDLAFGLARQLLEPMVIAADEQQRQRWFAGAAASPPMPPMPARRHRRLRS